MTTLPPSTAHLRAQATPSGRAPKRTYAGVVLVGLLGSWVLRGPLIATFARRVAPGHARIGIGPWSQHQPRWG